MDDQDQERYSGLLKRTNPVSGAQFSPVRLLLIPLLVFIVWAVETFLLEGSILVFTRYQPELFFVYMVVANILIGTIGPVLCLNPAFLSGAVNMYQVGFRSLKRTLVTVAMTACAGYLVLAAVTPYGMDRILLVSTALVMLPVAIASVMICWVLVGTHLQAYVRNSGAAVSILSGVLVTGLLFGLSFAVHSPPLNDPRHILTGIGIGIVSAVFFFAVRDIYAAAVFLDVFLVWVIQGHLDPVYIQAVSPVIAGAAGLSLIALAGGQWYLSRRFITIQLPVPPE